MYMYAISIHKTFNPAVLHTKNQLVAKSSIHYKAVYINISIHITLYGSGHDKRGAGTWNQIAMDLRTPKV